MATAKTERNERIVKQRGEGLTIRIIAERNLLSEDTVKAILARHRRANPPPPDVRQKKRMLGADKTTRQEIATARAEAADAPPYKSPQGWPR